MRVRRIDEVWVDLNPFRKTVGFSRESGRRKIAAAENWSAGFIPRSVSVADGRSAKDDVAVDVRIGRDGIEGERG